MPITKAESARLARRTGMKVADFAIDNNGALTLLNQPLTRACVFLLTSSSDINAEGLCSVYEIRPKGCRTYPFVLDENDEAILDKGCPHRDQFPEPPDDMAFTLLNLEERILQEGSSD